MAQPLKTVLVLMAFQAPSCAAFGSTHVVAHDPIHLQRLHHIQVASVVTRMRLSSLDVSEEKQPSRRTIVQTSLLLLSVAAIHPAHAATTTKGMKLESLTPLLQKAKTQLQSIPPLIESEKWDAIRTILITPPLSDLWTKSSKPVLSLYATALGDSNKDELAALEAKEELISHLRFLDMAVYNNVFNPIKTEGTSGATKGLIRSYYEDPNAELKACFDGLDDLLKLSE